MDELGCMKGGSAPFKHAIVHHSQCLQGRFKSMFSCPPHSIKNLKSKLLVMLCKRHPALKCFISGILWGSASVSRVVFSVYGFPGTRLAKHVMNCEFRSKRLIIANLCRRTSTRVKAEAGKSER